MLIHRSLLVFLVGLIGVVSRLRCETAEYEDVEEEEGEFDDEAESTVSDAFKRLIGEDETDFINHPDPENLDNAAYAVAYIEFVNETMNALRGEVRFIQEDKLNKTSPVLLEMWFEDIEPGNYTILVHQYGDMVTNGSCLAAGPPFIPEYEPDGPRSGQPIFNITDLQITFTVDPDENSYEISYRNRDTKPPPYNISTPYQLIGYNSIVGRMIVVFQALDNIEHFMLYRRDGDLVDLESYSNSSTNNRVGCGVVGIANNFTVYVDPTSSARTVTLMPISIIAIQVIILLPLCHFWR